VKMVEVKVVKMVKVCGRQGRAVQAISPVDIADWPASRQRAGQRQCADAARQQQPAGSLNFVSAC
jgi:hypothetical protein